jgi:hypothetical protein
MKTTLPTIAAGTNDHNIVKGIITDDYCHFIEPLSSGKGIRWFQISSLGLRTANG